MIGIHIFYLSISGGRELISSIYHNVAVFTKVICYRGDDSSAF